MSPNVRSSLRVAVTVLVVGVFLGLLVPVLLAADEPVEGPRVHIVRSGDTLWRLAETYAPDDDPRRFVFEVQRLNGLKGVSLQPGLRLTLPSG